MLAGAVTIISAPSAKEADPLTFDFRVKTFG